jgi:hypothetical protein
MRNLLYILTLLIGFSSYGQMVALISKSNSVDVPAQTSDPILSNFRVADANTDMVLFDASDDITGMTTTGFTIGGKTISGLTIDGDGLGGYFTVSSAFDYFQKGRTVKLESGDGTVFNYTMEHINNLISEPSPSRVRYVSVGGSGGGTGVDQSNEWTWAQMLSNYQAGDLIHVRAGNYGNVNTTFSTSGTVSNPVIIQGYKTSPNDINSTYWDADIGGAFTTSEMPTFNGGDRTTGTCFTLTNRDYIIMRNFQIEQYLEGLFTSGSTGVVVDRFLGQTFGNPTVNGAGFNGVGIHTKGANNSVLNSKMLNSSYVCFRVMVTSDYHLTDNCEAWDNASIDGNAPIRADYYFSIQADNVVTKNSLAHRKGEFPHHGHGFSYDDGLGVHNGLTENCTVVNIKQAIDLDLEVTDMVFRNIECLDGGYSGQSGGVKFSPNSRNNIFENCKIGGGLNDACIGWDGVSGGDHSGNKFRNCLFYNNGSLTGTSSQSDSTSFENCTFDGITNLGTGLDATNTFTNCLFNNVTNNGSSAVITYSNSFSGFALGGATNTSLDPTFTGSEYEPTNDALIYAPVLANVRYDKNKTQRASLTTVGWFNDSDETAGGSPPNPNLIENGTFDGNDATGWTLQTNWAITNNRLEATGATTLMTYTIPTALVVGNWYRVSFDLTATTNGVAVRLGGLPNTGNFTTTTRHSIDMQAAGTENMLRFDDNGGAFTGNIDNIEVIAIDPP